MKSEYGAAGTSVGSGLHSRVQQAGPNARSAGLCIFGKCSSVNAVATAAVAAKGASGGGRSDAPSVVRQLVHEHEDHGVEEGAHNDAQGHGCCPAAGRIGG